VIELSCGALRLVLAPEVGGAVAAFERDGLPLFRRTHADALAAGDVRGFASYPLLPFSNRIADATLRWDGASYSLPRYLPGHSHAIHGNAWQRAWNVVSSTTSQASLGLDHEASREQVREWPFSYRARQDFLVSPGEVSMHLAIINTSSVRFPCGLGWHPFFPRSATTELSYSADAMWETDAGMLPTRLVPIAARDFSAPRRLADVALDNCFVGWRPPALVRWPEHDLALTIDADPPCRFLVVYVPSGADYFAVEPASHMTNAFNRHAAGARDTGTRVLAPGETFSCTMRVSVQHT
jgi:aldose 1-epimerase